MDYDELIKGYEDDLTRADEDAADQRRRAVAAEVRADEMAARLRRVEELLEEWDAWANPAPSIVGLRETLRAALQGAAPLARAVHELHIPSGWNVRDFSERPTCSCGERMPEGIKTSPYGWHYAHTQRLVGL